MLFIGLHDGNDHDDNTMPWQARHTEAQLIAHAWKRHAMPCSLQAGRHYRENNPSFRKAVEVQAASKQEAGKRPSSPGTLDPSNLV